MSYDVVRFEWVGKGGWLSADVAVGGVGEDVVSGCAVGACAAVAAGGGGVSVADDWHGDVKKPAGGRA